MVPKALRSRDRTITIRVKDVTIISMAGAMDSTVINRKICSVTVGAIDCSALSSPMVKKGVATVESAAQLLFGGRRNNPTASMVTRCQSFRPPADAHAGVLSGQCLVWSGKNRSIIFIEFWINKSRPQKMCCKAEIPVFNRCF